MKVLPFLLAATFAASAAEIPLPVGSVSANQTFAVRNGNSFVNTSLDAYEGKILVVMMQTPWCPSCQSNGAAVGDGILDFFASSGGRNLHGIEIDSVMLSVEPASGWDSTNSTFASTNGYEQWGLDADAQRLNPRMMLGYYRGGYPGGVNHSNLYNWGEDRRRVVVLNLVRNSASHAYREIVINQNSFDSSNFATAQGLINAIAPPPAITTFAQWSGNHVFPAGTGGAHQDPDRDGCVNLLEFFHGTDPLEAASRDSGPSLVRDEAGLKLVYRRARNVGGFTVEHLTSTGVSGWQVVTPSAPPTMIALGGVDEISVPLPATTDPSRFYQLAVSMGSEAS